jgi:hypothetical protein
MVGSRSAFARLVGAKERGRKLKNRGAAGACRRLVTPLHAVRLRGAPRFKKNARRMVHRARL